LFTKGPCNSLLATAQQAPNQVWLTLPFSLEAQWSSTLTDGYSCLPLSKTFTVPPQRLSWVPSLTLLRCGVTQPLKLSNKSMLHNCKGLELTGEDLNLLDPNLHKDLFKKTLVSYFKGSLAFY